MSEIKPLPCPFCGKAAYQGLTKVQYCQLHGEPWQDYAVSCPDQHARIVARDKASAIAAWNRRAHTDAQAERIAILEGVAAGMLGVIKDYLAYEHDGDPWREDARTMGEMSINEAADDGRLASWTAALEPRA